jgi:DeoR/GlpR family transcriptional regulator of sugar metabolism
MSVSEDQQSISEAVRGPLMLNRRARIAELVRQHGSMRVVDLADLFGVTPVTIRSDLAVLEREGVLQRDHGGAVAVGAVSSLIAFEQRTGMYQSAKARIAEAAVRLVTPGDTILLDAGTTVVEMTRHLHRYTPLNVVTNALNVAAELRDLSDAQVFLLGGSVNYATFGTLGPLVEQSLSDIVVSTLFLAAESVDSSYGVTDSTAEIARVKRAMAAVARRVVLLADASNWRRQGLIKVLPFARISTVITDETLPPADRQAISAAGLELIVV